MSLVPDIGNVWGDIPAWRQLEVLDYDPSDPLSIYQYFASQYGNILQWPGVADVPVTQYSDDLGTGPGKSTPRTVRSCDTLDAPITVTTVGIYKVHITATYGPLGGVTHTCNDELQILIDSHYLLTCDCTDPIAINYDPLATCADESCIYGVNGCTDDKACNYDPNATVDDGSCCYGQCGCTDPAACNYIPGVDVCEIACVYGTLGCDNPNACNYDANAECNNQYSGPWDTPGNGADSYCCYDTTHLVGNASISCKGCMDSADPLYNSNAICDTNPSSCTPTISGCTNSLACNYDSNANVDDGTC